MSMEGRRFMLGVAAGALLALAVVVASGGPALPQYFSAPATPSAQFTVGAATSTTTYVTVTATTAGTTTSQVPGGSGNLTVSAGAGSSSSTTSAPEMYNAWSFGAVLPSSSAASLASQSPATNAMLAVPVLLALLFGAVLYRASAKKARASETDET